MSHIPVTLLTTYSNSSLLHISDSDDTAVRTQHDTTFVHNLLREVLEINVNSDDIGKIIRLGKRSDDGRNRPVLIGLKTDELKNRVMNNLGKLKNANEVYKKVSVAHDLSTAQRESVRNAVEEKKRLLDSNGSGAENYIFRVVGNLNRIRILHKKKGST